MKKLLIIPVIMALVFIGCNDKEASKDGAGIDNDTDDIFYAVGMFEARKIKQLNPTKAELKQILKGIEDSIFEEPRLNDEQFSESMNKINKLISDRMKKIATENKEKGKEYLEKYAKEKGVTVTESGLAYKITKEGSGKKPSPQDRVKVHYEGRFLDGEVFDSSKDKEKPAEFTLNRVIKGWTEGIQLVGEGGSIELVIPSELAYGDRGNPNIPGGSMLIFTVDLLEVVE